MRCLILGLAIGLFGWIDCCTAQEWTNIPDAPHAKSVVKITGNNGVSGSGTVVKKIKDSESNPDYYLGLILTASHCVDGMDILFEVEFYNGAKTNKAKPVRDLNIFFDPDNDLAVVRALIPKSVPVLKCESVKPGIGDEILMSGYGRGQVRHWKGMYGGMKYATGGHIVFSWAVQGDSGGPIIHDGKLIGVICYGSGIGKYKDTPRMVVAPVSASNVGRILEYIKEYSEQD